MENSGMDDQIIPIKIPRAQVIYSSVFEKKTPSWHSKSSTNSSSASLKVGQEVNAFGNFLPTDVINNLRKDIIGEDHVFHGPFGPRKCLYLDQTASGRSVKSIEDFIAKNVLPVYGNTHTTTSFCGSQVSAYRDESRDAIHKSCQGSTDDVVIFCGSGATSAVHKLVHSVVNPKDSGPIVLIGPFEHHSNIIPWREVAKKIINIPEDTYGLLDLKILEQTLKKLKSKNIFSKRVVIGTFSSASNVTGVLTDDVAVTILMHKYGGLAFWDYAAAAPHVKIDMNPKTGDIKLDQLAKKDALFFSGHKFTGGPQTTGILIAKKDIFQNSVPHNGGGGTVLFVTTKRHQYLSEIEDREEGGTPDIIGSIRLGLVFQLKNTIGIPLLIRREGRYTEKVLTAWKKVPEILILGSNSLPRIPIVSIMIKHLTSGFFLHHDFVVALLNDLFGIQSRGGCMCAGPYAQNLLGIDDQLAVAYEEILSKSDLLMSKKKQVSESKEKQKRYDKILKPGFVRISLPFHASEEEIDFTIDAVKFVAIHGWKLLPFYKMDLKRGIFRVTNIQNGLNQKTRRRIKSFRLQSCEPNDPGQVSHPSFDECLRFGQDLIFTAESIIKKDDINEGFDSVVPQRMPFRWFLLPTEAEQSMNNPTPLILMSNVANPIVPKQYYQSFAPDDNHPWSLGSNPHEIASILCNSFQQRKILLNY